ncbi:MAG: hypothetical protein ABF532_09160 [Bifidobacterium sp.]|jgi:Meckel syndrome type 1 protein|uniref:hypothetical protein n=1 Tax=Bifidobacterium sp. TaxID=41200 RepID=UPI0039E78040
MSRRRTRLVDGDLDPKASAADLEYICVNHFDYPSDIISAMPAHPACWSELADWCRQFTKDPGTAGAPPMPPEPAKRGILQRTKPVEPDGKSDEAAEPVEPIKPAVAPASNPDDETTEAITLPLDAFAQEEPTLADAPVKLKRVIPVRRIMIVAVCVVALTGLGGATAAGASAWHAHQEQAAAAAAAEHAHTTISNAERLCKEVKSSPVKSDKDLAGQADKLDALVNDAKAPSAQIAKATASLRTAYGKAMDAKAEQTGKRIDTLTVQANRLKDSPESADRTAMLDLAKQWGGKSITRKNLAKALDAAARLDALTSSCRQAQERTDKAKAEEAKRKADEEQRKTQAEQQQPAPVPVPAPAPQAPAPSYAPRYTPAPAPAPAPAPQQKAPPSPGGNNGAVLG